jgi:hypothetical protein
VRRITKIFKDTQLRIAFRTQNTVENILRHKQTNTTIAAYTRLNAWIAH